MNINVCGFICLCYFLHSLRSGFNWQWIKHFSFWQTHSHTTDRMMLNSQIKSFSFYSFISYLLVPECFFTFDIAFDLTQNWPFAQLRPLLLRQAARATTALTLLLTALMVLLSTHFFVIERWVQRQAIKKSQYSAFNAYIHNVKLFQQWKQVHIIKIEATM